jgi:hypothetical protein
VPVLSEATTVALPKRLDGRQAPDDCAATGHPLHADGERDRHHGREGLGHGRHREADPGQSGVGEREAADDGHDAERHGRHADGNGDRATHTVELARQRGGEDIGLMQQRGDAAELGMGAGRDADPAARARSDDRPRVQHAVALGKRRGRRSGRDPLVHRRRLAGERRLSSAQGLRLQQPQVGENPLSLSDGDDVPGNDLLGFDLDPLAVAAHASGLLHQRGEGRDSAPGTVLLAEADERVEHHDRQHDQTVLEVAQRDGDRGGQQQWVYQRIAQLPEQKLES